MVGLLFQIFIDGVNLLLLILVWEQTNDSWILLKPIKANMLTTGRWTVLNVAADLQKVRNTGIDPGDEPSNAQVAFARRALTKPELKMAHNLHTVSSLVGGALFIADECFPQTPYLHAAWHLAAAVGIGTCNKLLEQ